MQPTLSRLVVLSVTFLLVLTGCHKNSETTDNAAAASAAASQAVPMSAAPADNDKNIALVNENNAAVDSGPDATASAASDVPASVASATDAEQEDGADNSAMDKITENDKVIDNEPASPNAPKAADESETNAPNRAVGNQKVGQ